MVYTRAHTSASTLEALASRIAGGSATAAQQQPLSPRQLPYLRSFSIHFSILLLTMVSWSPRFPLVSHLMACTDAGIHPYSSLMPSLYDPTPLPLLVSSFHLRIFDHGSALCPLLPFRHVWSTRRRGVQTRCRLSAHAGKWFITLSSTVIISQRCMNRPHGTFVVRRPDFLKSKPLH